MSSNGLLCRGLIWSTILSDKTHYILTISIMKNTLHIQKKVGFILGTVLSLVIVTSFGVTKASAEITSNLGIGSTGNQVTELQQFLATNSYIYPSGIVSGYYGALTAAAVVQYQLAYNISPVGTVGPVTGASINNVIANGRGLDVSSPILSTPALQINRTTATVSWNTNEAARGKLIYSTAPIMLNNTSDATGLNFIEPNVISGILAPYDAVARFNQSITISNLNANTVYYYLVEALDGSNNVSITLPASFITTN